MRGRPRARGPLTAKLLCALGAVSLIAAAHPREAAAESQCESFRAEWFGGVMGRLAVGAGVYPQAVDRSNADVDLTVGMRGYYELAPQVFVGPLLELGYAHQGDDGIRGEYFQLNVGIAGGWTWLSAATVTTLLLGTRQDVFDAGVRVGGRLETLFGVLGAEVSWEYRNGDAGELTGLHVMFSVDLALPISLLTRALAHTVRAFDRAVRCALTE